MRLRLLLPLLLLLLVPRSAAAQTQRYYLTGHVTSVNLSGGSNPSVIAPNTNVGDTVSGFFDFNPLSTPPGIFGPVQLAIDGDVWRNGDYFWSGGLPSSGTTNIKGSGLTGSGPGGVLDSIIYIDLVKGVGSFGIVSEKFGAPGQPGFPITSSISGDIQLQATPEPASLALAVPCLLPGVWWLRRRAGSWRPA